MYRPICVRHGRKPRRPVSSYSGSSCKQHQHATALLVLAQQYQSKTSVTLILDAMHRSKGHTHTALLLGFFSSSRMAFRGLAVLESITHLLPDMACKEKVITLFNYFVFFKCLCTSILCTSVLSTLIPFCLKSIQPLVFHICTFKE